MTVCQGLLPRQMSSAELFSGFPAPQPNDCNVKKFSSEIAGSCQSVFGLIFAGNCAFWSKTMTGNSKKRRLSQNGRRVFSLSNNSQDCGRC
jgi:hypothetical protein